METETGSRIRDEIVQIREGLPVVALDIIAFATVLDGTHKDGFEGSVIISRVRFGCLCIQIIAEWDDIEDSRCKSGNRLSLLCCHVPHHGKGLQINFRPHYGRPIVKEDATLQLGQRFSKHQKIPI